MTQSPLLWGASLACALGGAIAGTALGSTPAIDRSTVETFYQSHEDGANAQAADQELLPDHYPLVTRQGVVPVAELGERGLYSQARFRSFYDDAAVQLAYLQAVTDEGPLYAVDDASLRIGDPPPVPAAARKTNDVPAPLELAEDAASLPGAGRAKMIDVQAVLAMR